MQFSTFNCERVNGNVNALTYIRFCHIFDSTMSLQRLLLNVVCPFLFTSNTDSFRAENINYYQKPTLKFLLS